jgi:hypothetical protein
MRIVRAAPVPVVSPWRRLTRPNVALAVILLFAVLALATAAIVYVSWPLVFALVLVGAAVWCRHLEQIEPETDHSPLC